MCFEPLLVLILIGIVLFVMKARPPETGGGGDEGLRIARERFARGEIGKEEYEEIRRTLGG